MPILVDIAALPELVQFSDYATHTKCDTVEWQQKQRVDITSFSFFRI